MAKLLHLVSPLCAVLVFLINGVHSQPDCSCPPPPDPTSDYLVTCLCNGFVQADWNIANPVLNDMVAVYRCSDEEIGFNTQPLTFLWACGGDGMCLASGPDSTLFDEQPPLVDHPDFEWPIPPCECLFVVYQRGDVAGQSPPPYQFVIRGENFEIEDDELCPLPSEAPSMFPTPDPTPAPTLSPTPDPTPLPSPSPTPDPTPFPSPSPTPDPTPLPSPSPTPDPTPLPTPLPSPSPTPLPSPSPTPPPTPQPVIQATTPPAPPVCEEVQDCFYVCGEAPCKRPSAIIFEFTGHPCNNQANNNTQEGKFECTPPTGGLDPSSTAAYTIEFADKGGMIGVVNQVKVKDCLVVGYYQGSMESRLVDCTTLKAEPPARFLQELDTPGIRSPRARLLKSGSRKSGGGGGGGGDCKFEFEADTTILIKEGGVMKQESSIHTSCSKTLFVGDIYASLTVRYLLFELS